MFHPLRKTPLPSTIGPFLSSVLRSSSSLNGKRWLLPKSNDSGRSVWNFNGSVNTRTVDGGYCVRYDYNTMSPLLLSIRNKRLYSAATRVIHQQEGSNSNSGITSSSISKRLELEIDKVRSKVHWNLSDFFSVVSAFSLLTAIIFGPYVVE